MNWSHSTPASKASVMEEMEFAAQRQKALACMTEAFAEGLFNGIEADLLAQAAFSIALQHIVGTYGEDTATRLIQALPEAVNNGEYSLSFRH